MTDYDTLALQRWRHYSDVPLLILAVGSLPLLLLELVRTDLTRGDRVFLDVVNAVVLVAFLVDYVVELWLARPRGRYVRAEWTSLLIVVAQALALAPGLTGIGALRVLRAAECGGSSRSSPGSLPSAAPSPPMGSRSCAGTQPGSPSESPG